MNISGIFDGDQDGNIYYAIDFGHADVTELISMMKDGKMQQTSTVKDHIDYLLLAYSQENNIGFLKSVKKKRKNPYNHL